MEKKKSLTERMLEETLSDNSQVENCKQCKDCIFKDERGHDRAVCMIYQNIKPLAIINNKRLCDHYNNGENIEEES